MMEEQGLMDVMRESTLIRCMVQYALDREEEGAPEPELEYAWRRIERAYRITRQENLGQANGCRVGGKVQK
jgi:hypothetical protein